MSDSPGSRLEQFLESTARRVSGGRLHPLEILERVQAAAEASIRNGIVGNDILIELNPRDYARYERSFTSLRQEIGSLLDDFERGRGLGHVSRRRVRFSSSERIAEAMPAVEARFADFDTRDEEAVVDHAPTRRITRVRGVDLVIEGGERMRLTHTPFSIGRGAGNDLALGSLAVSRRHAEIVRDGEGFKVRDLGSRNGMIVNGSRVTEAPLTPRTRVEIGDVRFWLELRQ